MNTGAPASTQEADQRRFYNEVSHDRHISNVPPVIQAITHPGRNAQSSIACKSVWTEHGAPSILYGKHLRNRLRERLCLPVELGMLYSEPGVDRAIGKLLDAEVEELWLLPLFPQYSIETFQACIDKVAHELRVRRSSILKRAISPYYDHSAFIRAWACRLEGFADEHLLFCFRGLSLHHLKKPDRHGHCLSNMTCCSEASLAHDTCYRFQCLKTAHLIVDQARLPDTAYSVSFHSVHGPVKCIEPYTEDALRMLPKEGQKKIVVICPSHFTDCVETLSEIAIDGRQLFIDAGGASFRMITCLNASEPGVACLESLVRTESIWKPVRLKSAAKTYSRPGSSSSSSGCGASSI